LPDALFVTRIKHVVSVTLNTQGLRAMKWRWNKPRRVATFTYHYVPVIVELVSLRVKPALA